MPGANENFEHLLTPQQQSEAKEAAKKGNTYDTREKAIANTLGKCDAPSDALDYLANLGADDKARKADLGTKVAGGGSLSGPEQTELDSIKGRLSANETVKTGVMRSFEKDADERRETYQKKDFKELQGDMAKLKVGVEAAQRQLTDARATHAGDADRIRLFENAYNRAQGKFLEAEDIYKARSPEELAKDAEDEAETAEAGANKRRESYKALPVDKLYDKTGELYKNWDDLNKLTRRISSRGTTEEKAEHKVKLENASGRWNEASQVLREKEVDEQKRLDEENENTARATLSSVDIEARRFAAEGGTTTKATELAKAEADLVTAIAGGNAAEIADKQRARNQKAAELSEARKTLKLEEDALKSAKDRESKDFGSTRSKDTMDIKSWNEYDALPPEGQAQYLETVLANEDMAGMDFDAIDLKIKNKLATSFKERAYYGAEFADRMMSGEISNKEFPRLAAGNKDLHHMVADRVTNSEQAKAMAEKYGTTWEKMRNWAMKDYRWLMILIALITAVAGPVTTAGMVAKLALR